MAPTSARSVLLLSDFNLANLAGYLDNGPDLPATASRLAPFGQVLSILQDDDHEAWRKRPDVAVVWTRPEGVVASFRSVVGFESPSPGRLLSEVDEYAEALRRASGRVSAMLVPTWELPGWRRGLGIGDLGSSGIGGVLVEMNLRLLQRLRGTPGIFALSMAAWTEAAGPAAFNPKLWYMSKTPFAGSVFKAAAADIKAALRALSGEVTKLIVLDLDDTLWGGVVGDVGWQNLRLGGHDPIGEAYVDFQSELKALKNRGVLLALVSKNSESVALEAIQKHPEMVLRLDDFVGWRINWEDKAGNIASLVDELNLGMQSVLFIDDNPAERGRVREVFPDMLVPDWPADRMLYAKTLVSLPCFDTVAISNEDRRRTGMYDAEQRRESIRTTVGSLDEWLRSLQLVVTVEELAEANLKRATQLLNKTNQMNLTTRRLSEPDLWQWVKAGRRKLWAFRVKDRFGDSGLTGLVSVECEEEIAYVRDFVLSCRVFGRQVERVLLHVAAKAACSAGSRTLVAAYTPTDKNRPCLDFFSSSGLIRSDACPVFRWDLSRAYPPPDFITVVGQDGHAED